MGDLWDIAEKIGSKVCSPNLPTEADIEAIHAGLEQAYTMGGDMARVMVLKDVRKGLSDNFVCTIKEARDG